MKKILLSVCLVALSGVLKIGYAQTSTTYTCPALPYNTYHSNQIIPDHAGHKWKLWISSKEPVKFSVDPSAWVQDVGTENNTTKQLTCDSMMNGVPLNGVPLRVAELSLNVTASNCYPRGAGKFECTVDHFSH